jgi:twitching motility protein PilT
MNLNSIFAKAKSLNASDIHLSSSYTPRLRINGVLESLKLEIPSEEIIKNFAYSFLSKDNIEFFNLNREIDLSFEVKNICRIRANFFYALDKIHISFRLIPTDIPKFEKLGLPNVIKDFVNIQSGLVLVTGSTGSGKSTTLASLINEVNNSLKKHIITLEDPVEFIYKNKKSIVSQRNIGIDTKDFLTGLKSILREDPDIIMIGELRDKESMQMALSIAQTGHLVLASLHTNSAVDTINRIVDIFESKEQVRVQLSQSLRAIISQELVQKDKKRVLDYELLINTSAISNLIRENKIHQIENQIRLGKNIGMKLKEKKGIF